MRENPRIRKNAHYKSLVKSAFVAGLVLAISLGIGVFGYHYFFNISWLDSLVNASMILTGMGPVDRAETDGAKLFSSIYAIYSGVAFLTSVAVILSPAIHQFLRRFHLDLEDN
jgi:xanthine/uracil permease